MLDKYNTLATSMLPPKLVLMWEQVTQLNFLTYIETLRGQDDVHTKDWTKQPFHDVTRAWTKLLHACKELTIIGTEACQLMASMKSEEDHFNVMIKNGNPELVNYMILSFQYRQNIHVQLCAKLAKLMAWPPYNSNTPQLSTPQSTIVIEPMSLDTNPPWTLLSQG